MDTLIAFDGASSNPTSLTNKYIYIGSGNTAGTKVEAAATITGIPADLTNLINNQTQLVLFDGTNFHTMVADTTTPSPANGIIALNGAASVENICDRIIAAIGALSGTPFDTVKGSGPEFDITVKQKNKGAAGNVENPAFHDAPGKTSGIAVSDFSGGTTEGTSTALSSGKFLLRFEGFVVPDDAS